MRHPVLKLGCYQNYCIDSNQILHSAKNHQILVMGLEGCPYTHTTNPRRQTATNVKKFK